MPTSETKTSWRLQDFAAKKDASATVNVSSRTVASFLHANTQDKLNPANSNIAYIPIMRHKCRNVVNGQSRGIKKCTSFSSTLFKGTICCCHNFISQDRMLKTKQNHYKKWTHGAGSGHWALVHQTWAMEHWKKGAWSDEWRFFSYIIRTAGCMCIL